MSADLVRAAVAQRFDTAASTGTPAANEFVIFSKPELGRLDEANTGKVWDLFAELLAKYGVTVHSTKIMTGAELESSAVMASHYGVINEISRLGRPALTEPAEKALTDQYGDALDAGATVLGGHQFLEAYPEFSPYALAILFSNASVGRLGPGTYAAPVKVDADTVILLNGFHPRQLSFFTAEDTVCAFLHGSSDTSWEALRGRLIGTTDPAKADAGSLRGTLYADPAAYGLSSVSYNFNGVHMSAGPLEGLAELDRFFGAGGALTDWSFGSALVEAGADPAALVKNPTLQVDDQRGTAFDLTEGVDAAQAAPLLATALPVD